MKTETYETKVQGMICRRCEDIVTARLAQTRGVVDAGASYWKSRVTVEYDPDIITPGDIDAVLERSGYPAGDGGVGGIVVDIICLAAMVGLFFLFKYLPAQVSVPKAQEGAALGFIFVIGLLTSTHCIGMCGGIMLSQTTDSSLSDAAVRKKRGVAAALSYNGGRVFTSTAAGAVFRRHRRGYNLHHDLQEHCVHHGRGCGAHNGAGHVGNHTGSACPLPQRAGSLRAA
jgi:copper chaperone CopZ